MKRIALKIDVDTYRGTLIGVPPLIELLQQHSAQGSFFFTLGADRGGHEKRGVSLRRHYALSTRCRGYLLPSANIGKRCADVLKSAEAAGFETGIHAWDRVAWESGIETADARWVESEMNRSRERYAEIFGHAAQGHAAAGWKTNRHALRLTQRMGFAYASDSRGSHPFVPVIDAEIVACPQLPTTLPTLDEILALEPGHGADQAADRILQLSSAIAGDHVFTLRAELEGMKFKDAFARLLGNWQDKGYQIVALRDLRSGLDVQALPRHSVIFVELPGRRGKRMLQGPLFPNA